MNKNFAYQNGILHVENVSAQQLAQKFGTPFYVYSLTALEDAVQEFLDVKENHPEGNRLHIAFAVKSLANIAILEFFAKKGLGFDIVSKGELARVLKAGADTRKVVFSGVGKSEHDIRQALAAGIYCFNVESKEELLRLNTIAQSFNKQVPVALRVNPNVDAKTHPYISTGLKENKFGVPIEEALAFYKEAASLSHIELKGVDCHIGSQLLDPAPVHDAFDLVFELAEEIEKQICPLSHIDMGGGLGIAYEQNEQAPSVKDYLTPMLNKLEYKPWQLVVEPGRRLVGNAGAIITQVEYLKSNANKHFAVVDCAMNDLMRPALYDAFHNIVNVKEKSKAPPQQYDIVGPICETGDFLGKNRKMAIETGDLLAILSAGAYGSTMASNYNARGRAPEILVRGNAHQLIREREKTDELFALEKPLKL